MAELKNTTVAGNLLLPKGTKAQRPTLENGMVRYNLDDDNLEFQNQAGWSKALIPGLNFSMFFVSGLAHPTNATEFDAFFDENTQFLSLQQAHTREINWANNYQFAAGGQTFPPPSYFLLEQTAWKAEGYILAPETGTYIIGCDSDDASDVFIDGQLTANWYGGHGFDGAWENGSHPSTASHYTATIDLVAGQFYTFRARVESIGGGYGLQVGWQKPSDTEIKLIEPQYFFRKML